MKNITKYTKCIESIASIYIQNDVEIARTPAFANEVSQLAYNKYGLNAADSFRAQEDMYKALDIYFN